MTKRTHPLRGHPMGSPDGYYNLLKTLVSRATHGGPAHPYFSMLTHEMTTYLYLTDGHSVTYVQRTNICHCKVDRTSVWCHHLRTKKGSLIYTYTFIYTYI